MRFGETVQGEWSDVPDNRTPLSKTDFPVMYWFVNQKSALTMCRAAVGTLIRRLLDIPEFARPNSTACAFGQYRNCAIATKTFALVSLATFPALVITRETVAVETPANLATSLTVGIGTLIATLPPLLRQTGRVPSHLSLPSSRPCACPKRYDSINAEARGTSRIGRFGFTLRAAGPKD